MWAWSLNEGAELNGDEAGLIAYYRFGEELNGFTALDATGGGAHCAYESIYGEPSALSAVYHSTDDENRRLGKPSPAAILTSSGARRRMVAEWARRDRRLSETNVPTEASCLERLEAGFTTTGFHMVSINGTTYKVYCDMDRFGGGWTLLLNNGGGEGFDTTNILKRYPTQPSLSADYSILGLSDIILEASGHRQWRYMIEVELMASRLRTAVYTAPNLSFLRSADATERATVKLIAQTGDGCVRDGPAAPVASDHTRSGGRCHHSLLDPARPEVNPWGSLVNTGTPTECHRATTFFTSARTRAFGSVRPSSRSALRS